MSSDDLGREFGDEWDDGEGSAGVREPRNPRPLPISGAGARPEPAPFLAAQLS